MDEFVNFVQLWAFELAKVALPIIAVFVIKALNALAKKWLSEFEANQPQLAWVLEQAVEMAVKAAEQAKAAGLIEDKKQHALETVQLFLNEHGWNEVDVEVLDAAIEAEVLRFKNNL